MIEKDKVIDALEKNDYVQRKAATFLGISESYLHKLMKIYNISRKFPASCYISKDILLNTLKKNDYIKYKTAEDLKVPLTTINILLDLYNIKIPETGYYSILPIDTRLKAYILGFCICDSGITENEIVELGIVDPEPIHILSLEMNASPHIGENSDGSYRYRLRKKVPGIINIYKGRLKKDRNIPFDIIPPHLFKYFILGMFDADGCLCFYMGRGPSNYIEFTSQGIMLPQLYDYFKRIYNMDWLLRFKENKNCYKLCTNKRDYIVTLLSIIYSDPSFIILPRKYYKAIDFLNSLCARDGLVNPVNKEELPIINSIKPFIVNT